MLQTEIGLLRHDQP